LFGTLIRLVVVEYSVEEALRSFDAPFVERPILTATASSVSRPNGRDQFKTDIQPAAANGR